MLAKRIIPCLDVHAGRVVKGVNFLNLRDAGDPVEVAERYEQQGADELVFLDITASHEEREIILVRQAALRFGSQCIVVNIDPKRVPVSEQTQSPETVWDQVPEALRVVPRAAPTDGPFAKKLSTLVPRPSTVHWDVHINGGRVPTGLDALAWARYVEELGAGEIVLTSMDADGTKDGYDIEITRAVANAVEIPVVASGGCGSPEHMVAALTEGSASAALAASIFHYGEYTISETKECLAAHGVPVRV